MNDPHDNALDDREMLRRLTARPSLGPRAPWPLVMMDIARAAATRSRDATTRVGAAVCTKSWRVLGTGYNGPPAGSPESLSMEGPRRHAWVVHAEENALLQAVAALGSNRLTGCLLFSTHRPCAGCVMRASHAGIALVAYDTDELDEKQAEASRRLSRTLGLAVVPLKDLKGVAK